MAVINQDFFDFIEKNKDKDPSQLRLALKQKDYNFDLDFAITQIECRKKTAGKLKDFLSFPPWPASITTVKFLLLSVFA